MAEMVVLTFVGKAVASRVITTLVNRAFNSFDEYRKSEGMAATKEKLEQNLPHIQAVLLAVDRGQIKDQNAALDKWLWQLRDSVQEAEDAIDELDYLKLKEKLKLIVNDQAYLNAGCTTSIKKKITKLVESVPVKSDDSLKRLKYAVEGLSKVAAGVSSFIQLANIVGNSSDRVNQNPADTGAMLTESKVFGRDKEKELILKWLSNSDSSDVSAFSIVGMGGLGKSTLAQLVKDEIAGKEKPEFNPIIWVNVSDIFGNPDAKVIIRNILQDITKKSHNLDSINALQTTLKDEVNSKKFLLIFDNVWRDDLEAEKQWKQIMAPLKSNQKGSRILVTTRLEVVANMMAKLMEGTGEKNNRLLLGGLEEQEFLQLFNKQVFGSENPEENKNLQRLAKQIVKKLKGSPLAVKVIDYLLNNRTDVYYWDHITNQDISKILIDQNGIIATLKLNYHHLTEDVQQCFRYCSLFPQDHKFKRDELIKMWIGSGLIQVPQSHNTLRPEDFGVEYFDTLVRKSFFHVSNNSEDCYLMHDFMHEMAVFVSSGECLRTNDVSSESIQPTIRHLSVTIHSLIAIKEITHLRHLQSLFIEFKGEKPSPTDMKEFGKALRKLKGLRLLKLVGDILFQLPKEVGDLIHLRYICLQQTSGKELDWLPKSTYRLYHLETMEFVACGVHDLIEAKLYGMGNLLSLRYLYAPSSVLEILPGIGKMTSLQKLELFNSQKSGRKIGELGNLKNLLELQINSLDKLKDPEEAKEAKMKEKISLRLLSLNWSGEHTNSKQTLANMEPHDRLQKLHISGYGDDSFPSWITNPISMLISLELRSCTKCNTLPPLGKLCSLKYLLLSFFPELEQISSAFYGKIAGGGDAFPSLKELRILGMNKLVKWVDIEGRRKFPRLEKLVIEACPQLITLPALPVSLRILEIKNSGIQRLPTGIEFLKKLSLDGCKVLLDQTRQTCFPSSLEELVIEDCGNDTSLVCSIKNLVSLTRLELSSCHSITSLPQEDIFLKLASLREVSILKCTKLSSFGGLHALSSLRFLKLSGCDSLVTISVNKPPLDTDLEEPNPFRPKLEIEELHIDHCSMLLIEPLYSLCQIKKLHILDNYQPESLPKQWLENCTSLQEIEIGNSHSLKALPSNLDKLTGLKRLVMHHVGLIESLPDLPDSLGDLVLTGCNNAFKQRYKKDIGSNWYELADVTTVVII